MPNPRFLQTAERRKNDGLSSDKTVSSKPARTSQQQVQFPEDVKSSFLLEYNDFGRELIEKSNKRFSGTRAEIPTGRNGPVENMYSLKRFGLVTTIANDSQLRSGNIWPITPLQSELLFRDGKLPKPDKYWEDLGLLLYDTSPNGYNPKEAKSLYDSLTQYRQDLGLSQSDLSSRLLVVNAGLEVDASMSHGVRPIAIPGVTQVYHPKLLEKTGTDYKFEYGLDNGVPKVDETGRGNRTIYMPNETQNIGLRVLVRYGNSNLGAWNRGLVGSDAGGRVNFAPQGAIAKK